MFHNKNIFKCHLNLAIKMFVHDPAESNFIQIISMKTRQQWAEKVLWDNDVKTTTDDNCKLIFEISQTGQQLWGMS